MARALPSPVKAGLGLLVAAAVLGLVEVALRLVDLPDPGLYEGDRATVWFLRPGLDRALDPPGAPAFRLRTNAAGLRGRMPPEAGPWTLALGCSTTMGWGVAEAEAWPARLEAIRGEAVVNGGVPGWSSLQAVRGADRWLGLGPTRVIVAYGVRDAWPAAQPDAAARPTPALLRLHLTRLLREGLRATPPAPEAGRLPATPAAAPRVPPDAFSRNLDRLARLAGDAEVIWLAMPQPDPTPLGPWRDALAARAPLVAPALPPSAFFPDDPVHLTPAGHAAVAAAVAGALPPL